MPAEFRKLLETGCGDDNKFCLTLPDEAAYITCLTFDRRDALQDQIEREEEAALIAGREYDRDTRERNAFGSMIFLPFDGSGRIVMPVRFREEAKIEDSVFFYGRGATFEIWNPRIFIETPGLKERDKRSAVSLMAQKGAP